MQNAHHYNTMARKLRSFFHEKGYIEIPASSRLSIMAACEDPRTVTTFKMAGQVWPCSQTGQMWLELELLKNPDVSGVFCVGPSFRNEPNPIPGRHHVIFPMFDFEGKGSFADLQRIERDLLVYLGLEAPQSLQYDDLCTQYSTDLLETEHEERMCKEVKTAISLEKFPLRSDPFWNMKYVGEGLFNKIDIILYGQETIGSAERSCNPEEMLNFFHSIIDGKYAQLLFDLFGKDRVMKEMDEYLALDFFPRFGGGIGMTRLENAMKQAGLFDIPESYCSPYTFVPSQMQM